MSLEGALGGLQADFMERQAEKAAALAAAAHVQGVLEEEKARLLDRVALLESQLEEVRQDAAQRRLPAMRGSPEEALGARRVEPGAEVWGLPEPGLLSPLGHTIGVAGHTVSPGAADSPLRPSSLLWELSGGGRSSYSAADAMELEAHVQQELDLVLGHIRRTTTSSLPQDGGSAHRIALPLPLIMPQQQKVSGPPPAPPSSITTAIAPSMAVIPGQAIKAPIAHGPNPGPNPGDIHLPAAISPRASKASPLSNSLLGPKRKVASSAAAGAFVPGVVAHRNKPAATAALSAGDARGLAPSSTSATASATTPMGRLQQEVMVLKAQLLEVQAAVAAAGQPPSSSSSSSVGTRGAGQRQLGAELARLQRALEAKLAELQQARGHSRPHGQQQQGGPILDAAARQQHGGQVPEATSQTTDPRMREKADTAAGQGKQPGARRARRSVQQPRGAGTPLLEALSPLLLASPASAHRAGGSMVAAGAVARISLLPSASPTQRPQNKVTPMSQAASSQMPATATPFSAAGAAPSSTVRRRLQHLLGILPSPAMAGSGSDAPAAASAPLADRLPATPTGDGVEGHAAMGTPPSSGFVMVLESPSCASPQEPGHGYYPRQGDADASRSAAGQAARVSNLFRTPHTSSAAAATHHQSSMFSPPMMAEPAELPPTARKLPIASGTEDSWHEAQQRQWGHRQSDIAEGGAFSTPAPSKHFSAGDNAADDLPGLQSQGSSLSVSNTHVGVAGSAARRAAATATTTSSRFSPEVLAKASAVAYPTAPTLGLTGSLITEVVRQALGPVSMEGGRPSPPPPSSIMVTPHVALNGRRADDRAGSGVVTFRMTDIDSTLADAGMPVSHLNGGRRHHLSGAEGGGDAPGQASTSAGMPLHGSAGRRHDRAFNVHSQRRATAPMHGEVPAVGTMMGEAWADPGRGEKRYTSPCFYPSGVGPAPSAPTYCINRGGDGNTGKIVLSQGSDA